MQQPQEEPEMTLEERVRRQRKRGHPSKMVGFRCPEELLDAADREGEDRTEGLVLLLDRGDDAKTELGSKDWAEVVVRAYREGITEGQALGRMVKELLDKDRKGKK